MNYRDVFSFVTACKLVVNYCTDDYAKAYAKAGIAMRGADEIRTQCLYILSNMGHWRGPVAQQCREVFKGLSR